MTGKDSNEAEYYGAYLSDLAGYSCPKEGVYEAALWKDMMGRLPRVTEDYAAYVDSRDRLAASIWRNSLLQNGNDGERWCLRRFGISRTTNRSGSISTGTRPPTRRLVDAAQSPAELENHSIRFWLDQPSRQGVKLSESARGPSNGDRIVRAALRHCVVLLNQP